jgi:hypothetical protein
MSIVVCNCSKSFIKKNKDLFRWNDAPLTNGKQYELLDIINDPTNYENYTYDWLIYGAMPNKDNINNGIWYHIINNNGKKDLYPAKLFITLAELRQQQMDSVLND